MSYEGGLYSRLENNHQPKECVQSYKIEKTSSLDKQGEPLSNLIPIGEKLVKAKTQSGAATWSCTLNLMNTMVGAGILALPYAFSKMGVIMGLIVMALSSLGTMFCLHILSVHTLSIENPSYSKLARMTMPKWKVLVDCAIALMCFGNAIGYLCLIGDNIPDALSGIFPNLSDTSEFVINRRFWIVLLVEAIIFPLCMLRNLHSLRHISMVSIMTIAWLTTTVVLYASKATKYFKDAEFECPNGLWYIGIPPGIGVLDILREVPLFVFGFTCHQNVLSLCAEAQTQNQGEFNRIIVSGVGGAAIIYSMFAITGFYLIGTELKADIIMCLPKTSAIVDVCRFGIALNMAFSIPLQIHPSRNSLTSIIFGSGIQAKDLPVSKYFAITFVLLLSATGISLVVTDIDVVFGLVGAVCGLFICYILPGFFYIQLRKKQAGPIKLRLSLFVIIFGVVALPLFVILEFI